MGLKDNQKLHWIFSNLNVCLAHRVIMVRPWNSRKKNKSSYTIRNIVFDCFINIFIDFICYRYLLPSPKRCQRLLICWPFCEPNNGSLFLGSHIYVGNHLIGHGLRVLHVWNSIHCCCIGYRYNDSNCCICLFASFSPFGISKYVCLLGNEV